MNMNLPAIPKTIFDYCEARTQALALISDAVRSTGMAKDILAALGSYVAPTSICYPDLKLEKVTKEIDRGLWRQAFTVSGFMAMLDAEAYKKFMQQVDNDPPEFNEGNIRATFIDLMQQADMMFARGVVNVFRWLSDNYKTNSEDPFTIGHKAVMGWIFESNWHGGIRVSYREHASGQLNDLDRVFRVLDGKKHEPRALEAAINKRFAEIGKGGPWVYEDEYFQIKGFKNNNAHIVFKRADLLEKVNAVIGKYYGDNALAERKAA